MGIVRVQCDGSGLSLLFSELSIGFLLPTTVKRTASGSLFDLLLLCDLVTVAMVASLSFSMLSAPKRTGKLAKSAHDFYWVLNWSLVLEYRYLVPYNDGTRDEFQWNV